MTTRLWRTQLCLSILVAAAGCTSRAAFSPQPMQLELDVIERSLASIEARDGGAGAQPIELKQALHATYDAVAEARAAVKARESGDGRTVDMKIFELRRRLAALDAVLVSAGIFAAPGLHVLMTADDYRPDAGGDSP